jgi:hypothetical protein
MRLSSTKKVDVLDLARRVEAIIKALGMTDSQGYCEKHMTAR